ncbi:tetratricopeptide repeat protein [Adlercreutzia sp. R7]|uniref:Tetratricopeptide repeat protein n=1 Tax=Adlercreutzia wanghongyangiae TaxID=3111451 RepID=A0ABU6IH16_9ACTN|nr:tetratricopeptide repeat protein [Adlercreutzia sp. R7]
MLSEAGIEQMIEKYQDSDMGRALYWQGRLAALRGDEKTAARFYLWSSGQGDACGACALGRCYRSGKGVSVDTEKAFEFAMKAARAGDCGGCLDVGLLLKDGVGAERDREEAILWFKRAAMNRECSVNNKVKAIMWVGDCHYENGDLERALEAYQEAIEAAGNKLECKRALASCLDKAGFAEWARMRYISAREYWEREQRVLYEYGQVASDFDYDSDSNVDRVTKNIIIAADRVNGLVGLGGDVVSEVFS